MKKLPFVTKEQIEEIVKTYPTPFHIYDEKGIRANAQALKEAFSWAAWKAAEAAAYYSTKREGENVEVDYTQVKNIKKPSGSKPGFVTYKSNYSAVVTPCDRVKINAKD